MGWSVWWKWRKEREASLLDLIREPHLRALASRALGSSRYNFLFGPCRGVWQRFYEQTQGAGFLGALPTNFQVQNVCADSENRLTTTERITSFAVHRYS